MSRLYYSPQETQERPDDYEQGENRREKAERLAREQQVSGFESRLCGRRTDDPLVADTGADLPQAHTSRKNAV